MKTLVIKLTTEASDEEISALKHSVLEHLHLYLEGVTVSSKCRKAKKSEKEVYRAEFLYDNIPRG